MMKDAKGNTLSLHDAVLLSGGADVWYVADYDHEGSVTTLTLARRDVHLEVPHYKVVKTECPHGWGLSLSAATMKMTPPEGTIGITPPVNLGIKEDKDLLEKLKRVHMEWCDTFRGKSRTLCFDDPDTGLKLTLNSDRSKLCISLPDKHCKLGSNFLYISSDTTLKYIQEVVQDSYSDMEEGTSSIANFIGFLVEGLESELAADVDRTNFARFTEAFKL